ncbi:hypothetical protein BO70DRAFT_361761 [Aspergillus heteromorphus CBS 117.55]|uniref:Uncharacterized protein n=1 Tax=Aspergillus heteromorphus CBS 117.55 TaxID=1448321 RepID=A0A317WBW0_9EURO|nr:uncharacterized protein BO70DRAFT_361761 [Aspergillus heteromorphus CBS 117.55]PWY82847.1 hypothetical protein BO70DRAFT_361761 [Aspergillus heteromorphus CBS 117.55]
MSTRRRGQCYHSSTLLVLLRSIVSHSGSPWLDLELMLQGHVKLHIHAHAVGFDWDLISFACLTSKEIEEKS